MLDFFFIPLAGSTSSLGWNQIFQQRQLIQFPHASFVCSNVEPHPEKHPPKKWKQEKGSIILPSAFFFFCNSQWERLTAAEASRPSCASWRPRLCWLDMKCPAGYRLAETASQLGVDLHILCLVNLKPCQAKHFHAYVRGKKCLGEFKYCEGKDLYQQFFFSQTKAHEWVKSVVQ